jgi:hypothetical protein
VLRGNVLKRKPLHPVNVRRDAGGDAEATPWYGGTQAVPVSSDEPRGLLTRRAMADC